MIVFNITSLCIPCFSWVARYISPKPPVLIKSKDIKYAINELPKIISLIKSNGIIPFSIYARYAFIAKKKLNSLKSNKIININSYLKILNSIDSITNDYLKLHRKSLTSSKNKKNFIKHFYHLRPGTYNICVERYRNKIDTYTLPNINNILSKKVNSYKIEKHNTLKTKIEGLLSDQDLDSVLSTGADWASENGYIWNNDLEFFEEQGLGPLNPSSCSQ